MAQVELLMFKPEGNVGETVQVVMVPVVAAECVADLLTVSTTVEGEKDTVGLAIRTLKFKVAVPDPVRLVAVIV